MRVLDCRDPYELSPFNLVICFENVRPTCSYESDLDKVCLFEVITFRGFRFLNMSDQV